MTKTPRTSTSTRSRLTALLVALALFASACGGGDGDGASGTASGGGGGGSDLACDVLSGDFVASLFGEPLAPLDAQRDGSNRRATSSCEWQMVQDADSQFDYSSVEISFYGPGRLDQQVAAMDFTELDGPGDRAVITHSFVDAAVVAHGDVEMEIFITARLGSDEERYAAMQAIAAEAIANL